MCVTDRLQSLFIKALVSPEDRNTDSKWYDINYNNLPLFLFLASLRVCSVIILNEMCSRYMYMFLFESKCNYESAALYVFISNSFLSLTFSLLNICVFSWILKLGQKFSFNFFLFWFCFLSWNQHIYFLCFSVLYLWSILFLSVVLCYSCSLCVFLNFHVYLCSF